MKGQFNKPIWAIMTSMVLIVGAMTLSIPYQEAFAVTPVEACDLTFATDGERLILNAPLNCASGINGITITANRVTLDCKGFTLTSLGGTANGIRLSRESRPAGSVSSGP